MTVTDDLNAISKVSVGTGGGASDDYPVTAIRVSTKREGPATQTRASYEEIQWTLDCLAEVSAITSITALNEELRNNLVKIGQAVTLTELATARTLPASGVGGSMVGYPRTQIADIPDKSFGPFQAFTLTALTRIPIVDGNDIIEHTTRTETINNADGTTQTTVTGSLRLEQGNSATGYVNTNILTPARTAAEAAGSSMTSRVTVTDDTSACDYSYTTRPTTTGTPGVTEAQVEDRTVADNTGRRVRTISGYAKGAGAAGFAADQLVSETSNLKLLRKDGPSSPSVPDGRVSFSYQYAAGVSDAAWPGIFITRFSNPIEQLSGGDEVLVTEFFDADPLIHRGRRFPYAYSERLEIEFIGAFSAITPTHQFTADNMVGEPRISRRSDGKLSTLSVDWRFLYATEVAALPSPRAVVGVEAGS